MRISDWSSDVCSSDLIEVAGLAVDDESGEAAAVGHGVFLRSLLDQPQRRICRLWRSRVQIPRCARDDKLFRGPGLLRQRQVVQHRLQEARGLAAGAGAVVEGQRQRDHLVRSEEHTSELQSLMRISYAVFCL